MAQYRADQQKAKEKAAQRYLDDVKRLREQAGALRIALGKHGFREALMAKLANVGLAQRTQDHELMREYGERLGSLQDTASDNEKSANAQSAANLSNAGRERANALSEAMAQGAGESDLLRAQGMALRNWNANQEDIARSFFDTQSSINSSLTDLTADTRSARISNALQAESDREQLYTNYFDQRSETLTQLGNVLGQMAMDYGYANEQVGSKKSRKGEDRMDKRSGNAFDRAARMAGQAYESPGVDPKLRHWDGAHEFHASITGGPMQATTVDLSKPEGATTRRLEQ
jgi:hypothetical protein